MAVILSGLPASGKTSLGKKIADALGLPFLDKDDFLENLFESEGVGDLPWRRTLSRKADSLFQSSAQKLGSVVLVSHWRPVGGDQESGTPIEWLVDSYRTVIEIHCECPPAEALERFFARTRHPGHLDNERDKNDVAGTLLKWANSYPLGIGKVISVSSEPGLNLEHLISQISAAASCRQK